MNSTRVEPEKAAGMPRGWAGVYLSLALISLFALAAPSLRADGDDWEKHFKSAEKAFSNASAEKYGNSWVSFFPGTNPQSKGQFAKAEREYRAALAEAQTFSAGDMRLPATLVGLAWVTIEEGKFADAEELLNQAIAAVQATHGADDARSNSWLGQTLAYLGLFASFDSKCDQAAAAWNRSVAALQARNLSVAVLQKTDGAAPDWLPRVTGRIRSHDLPCQLEVNEYVLKLRESEGAPDSEMRQALVDLAFSQRGSDAEQTRFRILELDQKLYGPDNLETLQDLEGLADIYASEGRYAAALPILLHLQEERQNSTKLEQAALGKEVDQYALLRLHKTKLVNSFLKSDSRFLNRKLAQADAETGRYPEAEELFKHLISEYESGPSPNIVMKQLDLAQDWMSLAALYGKEHRFKEAQDAVNQAAKNQDIHDTSKFGKMHNDFDGVSIWAWEIQNLRAELFREQGDSAAADPLFRKSIYMAEARMKLPNTPLPGDHMLHFPDFVRLLDNYATLLRDQGKYDESEALYKRALYGWAASQHPDVAHTLTDYATLLRKLDRPAEAEPLEARAAAILSNASAPSGLDSSLLAASAGKN